MAVLEELQERVILEVDPLLLEQVQPQVVAVVDLVLIHHKHMVLLEEVVVLVTQVLLLEDYQDRLIQDML